MLKTEGYSKNPLYDHNYIGNTVPCTQYRCEHTAPCDQYMFGHTDILTGNTYEPIADQFRQELLSGTFG